MRWAARSVQQQCAHNEAAQYRPQKEKVLVIVSDGRRDVWIISSEVN